MVSKVDSYQTPFNFLQSTRASTSPPLLQQSFFKNHQKWEISRHLNSETGSPIFYLKDAHGISHTTSEFIVENLDLEFTQVLSQLTSEEKQQKLILEYLQGRLQRAVPYQVHVGRHGDKLFLRFGDYGLKGGMEGNEKQNTSILGKKAALALSTVQVAAGIYCIGSKRSFSWKWGGGALISSGLSSGLYAYLTDKEKYADQEYAKQFGYGFFSGIVTGAVGKFSEKAGIFAKISLQALASAVASEVIEKGKNSDLKIIAKKTGIGVLGGGVGAATSAMVHRLLTNPIVNRTSESAAVVASLALIFTKMAESGLSSGTSKYVTDLCENFNETDPKKKKERSTLRNEAIRAAVISAMINVAISALEQKQKFQEDNETRNKIKQIQKDLEDAQAQKVNSESALQELQKTLQESEQNLIQKQNELKLQEQSLQEKSLQQQKIQEQIGKDQLVISEAQNIASTAEQELGLAQQALIDAQQQVNQHQQAVSEAQRNASLAQEQLRRNTQTAQEAQQAYTQSLVSINKELQSFLKKGFKAKINGHYTKNEEEIRNAYLQGITFEWKKGQNRVWGSRITVRPKPSPLMKKYQEAEEHAKQTEQKIQELQSSITQKQTELKIAEDAAHLHHQTVDQTQAELNAARDVQLKQAELDIAQKQLQSFHNEIQQAQQDMSTIQGAIKALEQQTNQFETRLKEELKKLQAISNKESGLTTLSKEQQDALHKGQQDCDKFPHAQIIRQYRDLSNRGALKKALTKAEPVSYVEAECRLAELIPHVVLVHALNHEAPPIPIFIEMTEKCPDDEEKQFTFFLQKMVTPDGTIGSHLQLKKIEFDGELADRPQLHWSWNQLVQPHGKRSDGTTLNDWEKARIAFLEPLSTFENGIYYKPFGVAPYDTFTFNSHRLSEKSILVIPESLENKMRMHLTHFRGRIFPYNDKEVLRSAVIDALQTRYPETWHICDAQGNLTGKKVQYSPEGYNDQTCIKRADDQVIVLINKEGSEASTDHKSEAFKEWHKDQRYIGLHAHSVTFWIESEPYFKTLTEFKRNQSTVKNHPLFAGNIKDIHMLAKLGALEALKFYQKLLQHDLKTGSIEVANYIINEAIYADLVSLFYQMNPSAEFDLSVLDLKMIFESTQIYLLNLLENIKTHIEDTDLNQKQKAMAFFRSEPDAEDASYCSILKQAMIDVQKAKEEALKRIAETGKAQLEKNVKPLCLSVAQDEWEKVDPPSDSIEFDLGKNWPHSNQLREYANKVLRTLPTDPEKLVQLYHQLSSYSYGEIHTRKDQYRLNIICSIIQWALQEKIYLESRKEYSVISSILANKLSRQTGPLAGYFLETEDFTLNTGDCLFDNIVAQLPSSRLTSLQLREEVVQYMRRHSDTYSGKPDYIENNALCVGHGEQTFCFKNWEQYLTGMSQPQVWGTELEVQALASHLDHPIVLLTVGMKPTIYNSESENRPLFLHHLLSNHFEGCVPIKVLTVEDVYNGIKNQPHYINNLLIL